MLRFVLILALAALARASYIPSKEPADEGIVGGVDARIEQHPYQLSLEYNNQFMCGGSLIKPNIVLTAAHCTDGLVASRLKIRAGSTHIQSGGVVVNVLHIRQHPKYRATNFDYDVSVLILDRSLSLSSSVQTIELQPVGAEVQDDTIATLTGWGKLRHNGPISRVLQMVKIPKVGQQKCSASYNPIGLSITERMECYGYTGGKGGCNGDSGGPIVVNGKQTGIVSWTKRGGCAAYRYPTVFVKVSSREITDHIQKYMALY